MARSSSLRWVAAFLGLSAVGTACSSTTSAPAGQGAQGGAGGTGGAAGAAGSGAAGAAGGGTGGAAGASTGGTGGTGGGISFDAAGGSGGLVPDSGCAGVEDQTELVPANILLLIDKSSSMRCNPPPLQDSVDCEASPVPVDSAQDSKWDITRDALIAAVASMPNTTAVGISYFPTNTICAAPTTSAAVSVRPLTAGQRTALDTSLTTMVPVGATPIVDSLTNSFIYFNGLTLRGNRFLVLITDGAESCNEPATAAAIATVATQAAAGIRTFVIGAPGSEPARTFLSEVAVAGGTAPAGCQASSGTCHFDMTTNANFAQALNAALQSISATALACEFDVPATAPDGTPINFQKVNVKYTPGTGAEEYIRPDNSADCAAGADGWQYADGNTRILLCGATCDRVQADPAARIDIEFGCDTVPE